MSRVVWAINESVDGIADHTVGVAVDDELHRFFSELLDAMDLVLFGRVTYQLMEAAWPRAHEDPNATEQTLKFADKLNAIPKVVFSRTLDKVEWSNSRLARGELVAEVTRLKQQPGKGILVDGISIAQELARRGLIDEYWFVVHPIVAGRGKRLIDSLNDGLVLRLIESKVFRSGAVALHYETGDRRS